MCPLQNVHFEFFENAFEFFEITLNNLFVLGKEKYIVKILYQRKTPFHILT